MKHMNSLLRKSLARHLFIPAIIVADLLLPAITQAQFHGGAIFNNPIGSVEVKAGDTAANEVILYNFDGCDDSLTITQLVFCVDHYDGRVCYTNSFILPATVPFKPPTQPPLSLLGLVLPSQLDSFTTNFSYPILPNDYLLPGGILTNNAIWLGVDARNSLACGGVPDEFMLTFPNQVHVNPPVTTNSGRCILEAVSDIYNPGGSDHAVWMPGISTNLIFSPTPGSWTENPDGSATLTGTLRSRTNYGCGFIVNVNLSGKTTTPPPGSPKKDHDAGVYVDHGGPVDPTTWHYYPNFTGTLTGFGNCWTGAVLMITRTGPAWQVGVGANGKNVRLGISAWFNWMVVNQRLNGPALPDGKDPKHGDFNLDIVVCPPCPTCAIPYPFASAEPRTSVLFNENEILRAFGADPVSPTGTVRLWYNDEEAMVLGVRSVVIKTPSGNTTTTSPVSVMGSNPGYVDHPAVGFTGLSGDLAGTDASGRPFFPSLFVTDVTSAPDSLSGDWQYGGSTPIPAHAVFGTWKAIVKTVDKRNSPPTVSYAPDSNPSKNNWNLGPLADPAPSGLVNEGYGAEARWNISELGLLPGRKYRLQFLVHDGDQSKAGGDAGQGCITVCMPEAAPLPILPRLISYESLSTGEVRLTLFAEFGRSYQIEASADLQSWRFVTVLENNSGIMEFSDLDRDSRRCFYRVLMLP
jgi:hypothetical protein